MNPIVGRVAQSDSGLWLGTMLLLAAAAVLFLASNDQKVFGQPGTQAKPTQRNAEKETWPQCGGPSNAS